MLGLVVTARVDRSLQAPRLLEQVRDLLPCAVIREEHGCRERLAGLRRGAIIRQPTFDGGALVRVPVGRKHGILHDLQRNGTRERIRDLALRQHRPQAPELRAVIGCSTVTGTGYLTEVRTLTTSTAFRRPL